MRARAEVTGGDRDLAVATALLQRMRLADPVAGAWEAADVQWWARCERPTDAYGQLHWLDQRGDPVAAVLLTDFFSAVQCDVLVLGTNAGLAIEAWETAISRMAALGVTTAEVIARPDDAAAAALLPAAGFSPDDAGGIVGSWLPAGRRPQVPPLPPGYRLLSRATAGGRPHPAAPRNGPDLAERLARCSLYRPDLDLMVESPDGQVAGYGLFWADPVTKVGLVEPMRTEDEHQGRGIASHVLASGLDLLARNGCERLKVSNDIGLYLRAGFVPSLAAVTWTRQRR
jgi:predicted N-acetyltransferase YhbS